MLTPPVICLLLSVVLPLPLSRILLISCMVVGAIVVALWRTKPGAPRSALVLGALASSAAVVFVMGYSHRSLFLPRIIIKSDIRRCYSSGQPDTAPILCDFGRSGWLSEAIVYDKTGEIMSKCHSPRTRWKVNYDGIFVYESRQKIQPSVTHLRGKLYYVMFDLDKIGSAC